MERVRESIGKLGREKGINQVVGSCIKDGVLREILTRNKVLRRWTKLAARAGSIEAFEKAIGEVLEGEG